MKKFFALFIAALCFVGCTYTDGGSPVISPITPALPGTAAAVVASLGGVNPDMYGGWSGTLTGSPIDGKNVAALCKSLGYDTVELKNQEATVFRFLSALAAQSLKLKPAAEAGLRPLLLIYYSGHGGQLMDVNGDEPDKLDETLCLYDGQLLDDLMYEGLCKIPAGIRVAFITDSCNSASNYKAPKDWVKIMRARAGRSGRAPACQFVHIGGCGDGESSYDTDIGGEATNALLATLAPGVTWAQWVPLAQKKMPRNQIMTYAELNGFGEMEAMK